MGFDSHPTEPHVSREPRLHYSNHTSLRDSLWNARIARSSHPAHPDATPTDQVTDEVAFVRIREWFLHTLEGLMFLAQSDPVFI